MHDLSGRSRYYELLCIFFAGAILYAGIVGESSPVYVVYAMIRTNRSLSPAACSNAAAPTAQSLLVVLLDRSGSLTEGTSPTDPNGYSTSVTKALADLWPGLMAVIPFSGDTTPLPIFGPDTLRDITQRTDLKGKVQNYSIAGDTPLAPAMQQGFDLLHQKGTPPGSRIIIITDGNPTGLGTNDGPSQEQKVRQNLIPQFCRAGIPVSVFGLEINLHTPDGQDADRLLADIERGTGAGVAYINVQSPEELAQNVIELFAQWRDLSFTQITPNKDGNFPVLIDSFADQVDIITFRANDRSPIILAGPDGQAVTVGVQKSIPPDRHYEIDALDVTPPIVAGTYIVNAGSDPDTQVYALVHSRLQLRLDAPTSSTVASVGQSVAIQARLFDKDNQLALQPGQATLVASMTLSDGGKKVRSDEVSLEQKGNVFVGETPSYMQAGVLSIVVRASYQGVKRQVQTTLQIQPKQLTLPPAPVCNTPQCLVTSNLLPLAVLATLVILFVIWVSRGKGKRRPRIARR